MTLLKLLDWILSKQSLPKTASISPRRFIIDGLDSADKRGVPILDYADDLIDFSCGDTEGAVSARL